MNLKEGIAANMNGWLLAIILLIRYLYYSFIVTNYITNNIVTNYITKYIYLVI